MPKGYWIIRVDVADHEAYKAIARATAKAFSIYSARYLVRGAPVKLVDGAARAYNAVVEFADYPTALACYNSTEYQRTKRVRVVGAAADVIIVEGYDGPQPQRSRNRPIPRLRPKG